MSANQAALDAFSRAALALGNLFTDSVTINIDADLASLPPGVLGGASPVLLSGSYNTIRNAMVADADADDAILAALPTAAQFSSLVPAGVSLSGNMWATKANLKALGFTGLDLLFGATDATITFSNAFSYDYDRSNGIGAGLFDFEGIVFHELLHALGFVSDVDNIDAGSSVANPHPLDLFRFEPGNNPSTTAQFTTNPRNLVPGLTAFFDDLANEWGFSTGVTQGDGRQASHWRADELSGTLIGIMDPTLAPGQLVPVTFADLRAMDLIGWDIAIPEPATVALVFAGGCLLWLLRRRRTA